MAAPAPQRLIVKVGSSLLVAADGALRRDWLATLVTDIAAERTRGHEVVVVSSGAIALGARRLGLPKGGRANLEDAQAAAATGQVLLSALWAELLGSHAITAAQMLVTLDDLEDRRRYLNASATLGRLLALGVVPVINENDSVATAEIRFGDNDRLAARIGQAAQAGLVLLLSDVDGLYDRPPGTPGARLVDRVARVDDDVLAMAGSGSGSGMGSGGMRAKLEAARIAAAAGIPLAIASGQRDHPLAHWRQTGLGTLFAAEGGAGGRKAWLAGRLTVAGRITIDAGAAAALRAGGSLLAPGAVAADGAFRRGDVVDIVHDGRAIARGLSEYDAADALRILGLRSDEQAGRLGHAPRAALVHRDHLVLIV
ncbi:glutamate 5-kinase [Sphingomonas changnyeongensis]|uniref:Glutamate 5-kinase n=1 Tax=Sphingomonas changnyeongensis TaxID=2698679 RepID=A0A7Z2NVT8_9SPHN|nr:glutamate 5-kinase [Sphingomonas changnyeongensis]QHL90401.1 glutamate 5-kinase [Sphingomonas changnyeongensis]